MTTNNSLPDVDASADAQPIRLGSRGSELARNQARIVEEAIRATGGATMVETVIITTSGDESARRSAEWDSFAGRKGLFTAEIEKVLDAGGVDVAVHSAKDLPSENTPGLEVRGAMPRAEVNDFFIGKKAGGIARLRRGARVATGSVRRQHQLRWKFPEMEIVELRGNVPTRLRKLLHNEWDGIILARAGLDRLGYLVADGQFEFEGATLHAEILPAEVFVPAGGQAVIALQIRAADDRSCGIVDRISNRDALFCLQIEREFLRLLNGDCDSPVGVLAVVSGDTVAVRAQLFEEGCTTPREAIFRGLREKGPNQLAAELWQQING